jgi:hypothetical protein
LLQHRVNVLLNLRRSIVILVPLLLLLLLLLLLWSLLLLLLGYHLARTTHMLLKIRGHNFIWVWQPPRSVKRRYPEMVQVQDLTLAYSVIGVLCIGVYASRICCFV